ncbi:hypothetical protein A6E15_19205 [Natrinema saccharevitans]|uniref:Uncharacterized protein n=1 Tax=Natrinema saccharevitans TaxID=301967 RepID=A0A1S8AQF8_9EURY|nr:hypothetical protein [Natrinema saccharevitans]OLZ39093.1 hypothetical protein A6E15_19205 [Natrinema saccharevitans]
MSESETEREWPDYSPLREVVIDADGMLALDFPARVGARPFVTYEDGTWRGVSVGPFDSTDDGETVMTTTDLDVDGQTVREWLEDARIVQLRSVQDTPLEGYDDWVYRGVGEPGEPVESASEYDPIEISDRQRERFESVREEWTDDHLPAPSDDQVLKGLLDTKEAAAEGYYDDGDSP